MARDGGHGRIPRVEKFANRLFFMALAAFTAFNTVRSIVIHTEIYFGTACRCFVRNKLNRVDTYVLLTNASPKFAEFDNLVP